MTWRWSLTCAIAPVAWGSTYYVTQEYLPPDAPLFGAVLRALPAGLMLLAVARRLPTGAWWWRSALLGALNFGAFFVLIYVSAQLLPSSIAATIMALSPVGMMLMGWALLAERPGLVVAAGGVLGIAGVWLMLFRGAGGVDWRGVAAALSAMALSCFGHVLATRWAFAGRGRPRPRLPEAGPGRPRLAGAGPGRPGPEDAGSGRLDPPDAGSGHPGPSRAGPGGPSPEDAGSGRLDPPDAGSGRLDPPDAGSGRPGPSRAGRGRPRPAGAGVDVLASTSWQMVAGGVLLLPVAVVVEGAPPAVGASAVWAFGYVAVVATAVAFAAWFTGLRHLSAATVGLIGLLNPVTGVLLGTAVAGERLTAAQVAGIALALCGVLAGQVSGRLRRSSASAPAAGPPASSSPPRPLSPRAASATAPAGCSPPRGT